MNIEWKTLLEVKIELFSRTSCSFSCHNSRIIYSPYCPYVHVESILYIY